MGFSRQEYWSGLPCPSPGDLPDPEIVPVAPEARALQADSLPQSHLGKPIYASIIETYLRVFINYMRFAFTSEAFTYDPHVTPALFPGLRSREARHVGLRDFALTVLCARTSLFSYCVCKSRV